MGKTRLDTLPLGVLVHVLVHLEPRDLAAVSATCRRLHRAANEPLVWRRIAETHGVAVPAESDVDRTSPAWAAQAGSRSVLPYKYAVCAELGCPPQDVGLTANTARYGRIRVGSIVIVHKHRPVKGVTNWSPAMDTYNGKTGVVTRLSGVDGQGCPGVRCSFHGVSCSYFFRIRDLSIVKI